MNSTKASIIIPVYNGQDTLEKTIDSALSQDYNNFEVIIVDDGSTDDSWRIAEMFRYDLGVTLIGTTNKGVASARNAAVAQASGDVILPLDADDLISRSYLTKTIPLMTDGVAVVSTGMYYFDDNGIPAGFFFAPSVSSVEFNKLPVTSLIRRRVFDDVGGYDSTIMYEDWDLWLKIVRRGWSVSLLDEPLFFHRIGNTGRNAMQDLDREKYRKEIQDRYA